MDVTQDMIVDLVHRRLLDFRFQHTNTASLHYNHTVMGKAEGKGELWHGHVTAVTVAPEYRRLGKVGVMSD